jgi:hypothetical protein
LPIADCQLPISNATLSRLTRIGNWQSAIKNIPETPKRGQSAQCPDRFFRKKRLFLQSNFWE